MSDRDPGNSAPGRSSVAARPPSRLFNVLSIFGAVLAASGLTAAVFFVVVGLFARGGSSYGSFTFIPIVAITVIGLAMVPAGSLRETRRRARGRGPSISERFSFDLGRLTRERFGLTVVFGSALASLAVLALGRTSTTFLNYTESNRFCGSQCHEVMHPEATVYATSPHARIECVECHVGPGAESFLHSKLSGLGQVFSVLTGNVPRPIPTPIRAQRPSREMCESCHWRERLIDYKVLSHAYFQADEESTPRGVRMMVKIGGGGGGDELLAGTGIHYHMFTAQKVEYIARDRQRQDIPWVRVTRADGSVTEFDHLENPLGDAERDALEVHTMECLDCHNRPAHRFEAPINSVNRALEAGHIPRTLPYIKRESVRALDRDYPTTEAALAGIADSLLNFYRNGFPEVIADNGHELEQSIAFLQGVYQETIFPKMKADWSAHPDNIGHRDSPGCFRCHNYEMESEDGDTIFKTCETCHQILAQLEPEAVEAEGTGLEFDEETSFLHPDGDEYLENQNMCSDCHDGGFRLYEKPE